MVTAITILCLSMLSRRELPAIRESTAVSLMKSIVVRRTDMTVYEEIFEVIKHRKADYENGTAQENSYTCYLFDKGVDKICKKIGEEATETVIAAKNGDNDELKNEINDLLYHVMVLCANQGLEWSEVEKVLDERNEKIGNLKKFHQVDKNS
jgi:phosphoribosyl-ATP pyrophosphohydrolase